MANQTSTDSTLLDLIPTALSASLGAASGVANTFIFLSIAKYRALTDDKEYLLLMALAIADAVNQLAYLSVGVYRMLSAFLNQPLYHASRWCLLLPHTTMWFFAYPLSNIMLLVISLDRILLVLNPLYYIQLDSSYMKRVLSGVYGIAFTLSMLGIIHVWNMGEVVKPCAGGALIANARGVFYWFKLYYMDTSMIATVMSVLVYCAVLPIHMSGRGKVQPSDNDQQKSRKLKKQRKMTKTLGISCLCTLVLYILPAGMVSVLHRHGRALSTLPIVCWLVTQTNSLANIFIYQFRHAEMRVALRGLLNNKILPDNLELWPTHV